MLIRHDLEPGTIATGRVAVLLSTLNGERFLPAQLASLVAQTHPDWILLWRDDGSSDGSVAIMEAFIAGLPPGRCLRLASPLGWIGAAGSFLALLRAAPATEAVAFADQDDVWLPDKLARGLAALRAGPAGVPALYGARQVLVDERLQRIGLSMKVRRKPSFPATLTHNLATGCTVMLNRAAASLIAASRAPPTFHDWWSYMLVSAAGGRLLLDDTPVILYRQHAGNTIGAPATRLRRAIAALRRGPAGFMAVFRQHVAALAEQPHLLAPDAYREVAAIRKALACGLLPRLAALGRHDLRRQTWVETLLFRWWFMLG